MWEAGRRPDEPIGQTVERIVVLTTCPASRIQFKLRTNQQAYEDEAYYEPAVIDGRHIYLRKIELQHPPRPTVKHQRVPAANAVTLVGERRPQPPAH
ncbi:hypothetical protein CDD80_6340 [Ophiocordyceps camponoti-rufipedis]|uniref:Uncharacterized protein n=1 Tax=Ophiocordyceps camponoti-rufipedis TaxID=2004952 RepID=A0A2C5YQF9_9HYPO|nr:hypothetical protein CDD80_6340 [Ophiocordyceps camponoti-rufipedis]